MGDATEKIEWAEKRIDQLEIELERFLKPKPYRIAGKRDVGTGKPVYYLAHKTDVDPAIVLLTGDILQNIRTALDYVIYTLVPISQRNNPNIGYPIFDSVPVTPHDHSRFFGKLEGARQEVKDYVASTKPYKGGNLVLWRLHKLNIMDKHRLLFTAGLAMAKFNIGQHMRATRDELMGGVVPDHWVPMSGTLIINNVGDEILSDEPGAEMNNNPEFEFDVAFNEPGISEGEPLKIVVRESLNWAGGIIRDLAKYV